MGKRRCIERLRRADFDAKPNKREVALRLDELVEVWRALGDHARCQAGPVTIEKFRILILTGQRECEVTDAAWSEFDLEAGLWRIPAARTKSGRAHLVHLAPQAVAILEELRALTGSKHHVICSSRIPPPAKIRDWFRSLPRMPDKLRGRSPCA